MCCTAWLAGDGDQAHQRYDVWFAFEFPSFVARKEGAGHARTLHPGTYSIRHSASRTALAVEGGSSDDNTPLVLSDSQQKVRRDTCLSWRYMY